MPHTLEDMEALALGAAKKYSTGSVHFNAGGAKCQVIVMTEETTYLIDTKPVSRDDMLAQFKKKAVNVEAAVPAKAKKIKRGGISGKLF